MPSKEQYIQAIQKFAKKWWDEIIKICEYNQSLNEITDEQIELSIRNSLQNAEDLDRPTLLMAQMAAEIIQNKENYDKPFLWLKNNGYIFENGVLVIGDLLDVMDGKIIKNDCSNN